MRCAICLVGVLLGFTAVASPTRSLSVTALPPGEYADTEMTTNCPFSLSDPKIRHLLLSLELDASPSNNVELAFGRDTDEDGVLGVREIAMALGWDAGSWVLRLGPGAGTSELPRWTAPAVTEAAVKQLSVVLDLSVGRPSRIVAKENGVPVTWTLPDPLPDGLYDNTWDVTRLAVRGIDRPNESVWAKAKIDGTTLVIK